MLTTEKMRVLLRKVSDLKELRECISKMEKRLRLNPEAAEDFRYNSVTFWITLRQLLIMAKAQERAILHTLEKHGVSPD